MCSFRSRWMDRTSTLSGLTMATPIGTAAAARQAASGYALRVSPRSERLTPPPGTSTLEVVFENKGKPAAKIAQATVDRLNSVIEAAETRLKEIKVSLEHVDLPTDLADRFEMAMARLTGLNGHMPVHWPFEAQRALVEMFFGGRSSTRFDRAAKHVRSDTRGIFVRKIEQPGEEPYWAYEARGSIGDFDGALSRIVSIYDAHTSSNTKAAFPPDELRKLSAMTEAFLVTPRFRSSPVASRRWLA